MAPYTSSGAIQVSGGQVIQNLFEKTLFSPFFEPTFSLEAAKLKAVGRVHEPLCKCCLFSEQCGISGLLKTLIMPDELYWAIIYIILFGFFSNVFILCFKRSQHLLQLFRKMLKLCFAVKLQKCFLELETPSDFRSAWGRVATGQRSIRINNPKCTWIACSGKQRKLDFRKMIIPQVYCDFVPDMWCIRTECCFSWLWGQ